MFRINKNLSISLLLAMLAMSIVMQAADKQNVLIVLTKDNVQHQFILADKPTVTFEGTQLKVTCEKASASASFNLSDVIRFTYDGKDAAGIDELTVDPAEISMEEGVLVISQMKANSTVNVYSMDGKLIRQLKVQRAGTYRLCLSSLPSGVYLVRTDNITYKITKR
jgi:hypothetical protein